LPASKLQFFYVVFVFDIVNPINPVHWSLRVLQ